MGCPIALPVATAVRTSSATSAAARYIYPPFVVYVGGEYSAVAARSVPNAVILGLYVSTSIGTATPYATDANWTRIAGWVGDSACAEIDNVIAGLRAITDRIERGRPPVVSRDLRILADQALASLQTRQDEDVDEWARTLVDRAGRND